MITKTTHFGVVFVTNSKWSAVQAEHRLDYMLALRYILSIRYKSPFCYTYLMNRKGFAPLIVIGIIALVAVAGVGIWYFTAHKNFPIETQASLIENGARFLVPMKEDGIPYIVAVYSADEQSSTVMVYDYGYCGGTNGEKSYLGDYQLVTIADGHVVATTTIGEYSFAPVANASSIVSSDPAISFLTLSEYATCDGDNVSFYVMDNLGRFKLINFVGKDIQPSVYISDNFMKMNGDLLTIGYYINGGSGFEVGYYNDSYRYDSTKDEFVFVSSQKVSSNNF